MSNSKNKQILSEMHPNDLHFKRIMKYYDDGTPSTKKQVAIVVTGNKNANRSNVMDALGDMDYREILDTEKLLKLKDESIVLTEGLGTAISKIRNLAVKIAAQKVDSAQNHLKLDKIKKENPNGKAAMAQAQMALTSQGNLDEDLKSIINKLAVKVGTSSSYGAILSALLSAGSWFAFLESTFMRFYYSEIQKLAEPEVFKVMQDIYGAKGAEGSLWGKFGMYAFFVFFVIALVSLAVARLSKEKKNEDIVPGGLAKGMNLTDIANHHKVDIDDLMKELELGIKTEMEHTTDKKVAEEIALDHLFEDPKYYTKLTAMEKGDVKSEAANPAERIQTLNNRIAKLRADMARAKSDNQKNIFQARLKNALQTLSNIRKDLGTKKESVKEAAIVYKINKPAVEKFLKKYPRVGQIMKVLVSKNSDVMKGYKAFIKFNDKNADYFGGRAEITSSPTFGTKTFYKYDWDGVGGWAEVYQYIYNQQNESINEDVNFRDGKYHFHSKNSIAHLTYNGKEIASGDFDGDADAYFMSHSSWKGEKAFDTGKDVIAYFKKNNIVTESVESLDEKLPNDFATIPNDSRVDGMMKHLQNHIAVISKNIKAGKGVYKKDLMKIANIIKSLQQFEGINEENEPTNPELWDRAIAAAKREYDVYPSAYANAFASKWYKERGGNWKTKKESVNEEEKSPEEIVQGLKQMAMGDLERIEDYAEMVADRMEQGQELSSWMYSQITLAVDQLNSVHDAMDGNDGIKESVNESKKMFSVHSSGGKKFDINVYDGRKNKDGSPFIDVVTANHNLELKDKIQAYKSKGYIEVDSVGKKLGIKYKTESVNEAKAGDFEIGDFVHFKSKNKTGMVKKIDGDKITIMTIKGDVVGDIKDVKVLYQDNINEAGPCWKGYKQIGMKTKDGREVPNCVPEALDLNESRFSEIDIMAKEAKSFRDFVKEFYKEYPKLPKDKDSMKWLEGLYKSSIDEVVDDKGNERVALALPQTKEESVNEDCGCNRSTLSEGVAKEILTQLGGNKFIAMTGAKNLVDGGKFLGFKLPRAKDGINYVKITLTSMDLYDIEFGRIRANDYKVIKKVSGIYNDQLQNIFTKVTGLHTRL